MRVLVACERSGRVRDAMRALGHDAMSCDLEETEQPGPHYRGDVRELLDAGWDLMVAHPECRYLCSSGLHHNRREVGRAMLTEWALDFVRELLAAPIARIGLENSVGCIGTRLRRELSGWTLQTVQPHQFGHDASKATRLYLKGLPRLVPTRHVAPRLVGGRPRWANQTDSGQNRLGPSETRSMDRARTYHGIADAMAAQWAGPAAVPAPPRAACAAVAIPSP